MAVKTYEDTWVKAKRLDRVIKGTLISEGYGVTGDELSTFMDIYDPKKSKITGKPTFLEGLFGTGSDNDHLYCIGSINPSSEHGLLVCIEGREYFEKIRKIVENNKKVKEADFNIEVILESDQSRKVRAHPRLLTCDSGPTG